MGIPESHLPQPTMPDTFSLYDLKVEVICPPGEKVYCGAKNGDHFFLRGEMLHLPEGQGFSIYSLSAVLPLLAAKQRITHPNDWMSTDAIIACPDPNCKSQLKVTRVGQSKFSHAETTAVPLSQGEPNAITSNQDEQTTTAPDADPKTRLRTHEEMRDHFASMGPEEKRNIFASTEPSTSSEGEDRPTFGGFGQSRNSSKGFPDVIFGKRPASSDNSGGLFGQSSGTSGGLFGRPQQSKGLFGGTPADSSTQSNMFGGSGKSTPFGGFGQAQETKSLFGAQPGKANSSPFGSGQQRQSEGD